MLQLQITYKDGEVRNITNDLNYDQFRALVEHVEKGNGKMAEFKEIKITKENIMAKMTNEQSLEAMHEAVEISTKPANPWKRKMVDKISQLLSVMKQGETIENKYLNSQEKGLYPN